MVFYIFGVIGPDLFENQNNKLVTVKKEWYTEMIQNFLVPNKQLLGLEIKLWFHQEGVNTHKHKVNMCKAALRRLFPGHLISRFGDVSWPASSLDYVDVV